MNRDKLGKFVKGHQPIGNYFKKGHIGFNKGKRLSEYIVVICPCGQGFEARKTLERIFCSVSCKYKYARPWGHHSSDTKKKISIANHKFYEKHPEKIPTWNGGTSFRPYGKWFKRNREAIRIRDNHTCQLCFKLQNGERLAIHHINYIKSDYNVKNLISLCRSCHARTNANRFYWQDYFQREMEVVYG